MGEAESAADDEKKEEEEEEDEEEEREVRSAAWGGCDETVRS